LRVKGLSSLAAQKDFCHPANRRSVEVPSSEAPLPGYDDLADFSASPFALTPPVDDEWDDANTQLMDGGRTPFASRDFDETGTDVSSYDGLLAAPIPAAHPGLGQSGVETLVPAPTRSQEFQAELGVSPVLAVAVVAATAAYTVGIFTVGFIAGTVLLP